jgi:hypothetical protein
MTQAAFQQLYPLAGVSSLCSGRREVAIATKPTKASRSSRTSNHGGIGAPETAHKKPRQRLQDADGILSALASPMPKKHREDGFVPPRLNFLAKILGGSVEPGSIAAATITGRKRYLDELERGEFHDEKDTGSSGDRCSRRYRGGHHAGAG